MKVALYRQSWNLYFNKPLINLVNCFLITYQKVKLKPYVKPAYIRRGGGDGEGERGKMREVVTLSLWLTGFFHSSRVFII